MKKTDTTMRVKFNGHIGTTVNDEAFDLAHNFVRVSLSIKKDFVGKVDVYQNGVEGFVINEKERFTVFKWGNLLATKITIEETRPFTHHEGHNMLTKLSKEYPGLAIKPPKK